MKKTFALFLLLCLLGATLCGCKKEVEQAPSPAVSGGYYSMGAVATGGGNGGSATAGDGAASDGIASDLNAKSLSVTGRRGSSGQTETVLQFSFVSGSRMSGGEQEIEGGGVPYYSVFAYDYPARLVVQFENLAFWDYRHGLTIQSGLVRGAFQYSVVESTRVSICFQLAEPVYFLPETAGDTLSIRLLPKEQPQEAPAFYYVTANAYDAYRSGSISLEFDSAPTYAANMQNILLISPPMENEEEAAAYLASARSQYPSIAEELWDVQQLTGQQLPAYDTSLDYFAAFQTLVVRFPIGDTRTLPVLIPDGLYLCDLPSGEGFLYSKELPSEEDTGKTYQQLMTMRYGSETGAVALSFDFAAIEKAAFSPDGRRLAILESSEAGSRLYVFDASTYELLNDLSEMGFGDNTSAFIWNSLGNTIYAITGMSGIQLHQFDYSIPDESQRHSLVDRSNVDEGSLGFCDGELYFIVDSLEAGAMIYRIKPEGGVRKPFIAGDRFSISPDNRYIAVMTSGEGADAAQGSGLYLYEMETGQTRAITNDFYPYDCLWSQDCSRLYYMESRVSGGQTEGDTSGDTAGDAADDTAGDTADDADGDVTGGTDTPAAPEDPYPFTLWVYDVAAGMSTRLLDLCAADAIATGQPDVLYLNHFVADLSGTQLRAAYVLDLNTVFQPQEAQGEETSQGEGGENGDVMKIE